MNNLVRLSLFLNVLTMIASIVIFVSYDSNWLSAGALMLFVAGFVSLVTIMKDYDGR